MTLCTEVAGQVSSRIRDKGEQYYRNGRVKLTSGNSVIVRATVRGSQPYDVRLGRLRDTIVTRCSCPYFQDNLDICKHIWATLKAAEGASYLQDVERSNGNLRLQPFDALTDDDLPRRPRSRAVERRNKPKAPAPPAWKKQLNLVHRIPDNHAEEYVPLWPARREILYIVDVTQTMQGHGLSLEIAIREPKKNGEMSKPRIERMDDRILSHLPDPRDRTILSLLNAGQQVYGGYYSHYSDIQCRHVLDAPRQEAILPLMSESGRLFLRPSDTNSDIQPLHWDNGAPWQFRLDVVKSDDGHYVLGGVLQRGQERRSLAEPVMLLKGGLVFWSDTVARLEDHGAFEWILLLRQKDIRVPSSDREQFQSELLRAPHLPPMDLPPEFAFDEVSLAPKPCLKVKKQERYWGSRQSLIGTLSFDYAGTILERTNHRQHHYDEATRRLIRRDPVAEAAALELVQHVGFRVRRDYYDRDLSLVITPEKLPHAVNVLLAAGWHVEAEGKLYRQSGNFKIEVTSGIDWFELHGNVEFGDQKVSLPKLLEALRKGDNLVRLDDGTFGMVPEEWLQKYGVLAGLGKSEEDHLRFTRAQVGLLDALLAAQPEARCDATFQKARRELQSFEGVKAVDPPAEFSGQLRAYQRDGLGWLQFLERFRFGGCLADDMGLGKTVQVLALLAWRKHASKRPPGPSLVVVPRSLVFNWRQEAARFTPSLRVLDHTGLERRAPGDHFQDYDLILTTYGTLRRDAVEFKDLTFDYCILDESQAIKNATTQSAKAVRLLNARHRLAMSGTPVENHLGELWSLFEFLNPGMLGQASVFRLTGSAGRAPNPETQQLLSRALRPFILRRTKTQVARDLPEKSEQTLYCDLEPAQRRHYDELREYYRRSLLDRIEREGMNKAKIQILEALLRLRQAACHPALIDKNTDAPSAKLDALVPQLEEVFEEGHKALVFSQFTSFLDILRRRLDERGIPYEYLDGKTRDRQGRVERFQNDPACKLFLISLKAGGLGLNLTAAEYVFLLDPWWNPAVESQAIHRAHRIGQTRHVFAYRLIARDTVEEKVLQLQESKRALADAIITADNSLIAKLGREDLELLLS